VRLAEARRGERLVIERLEQLADPSAELLLNDLLDVGEGNRADVVLEVLKLLDVRLGNEIGSRRQDLPELHVRGSELDESFAKGGRARGLPVAVHDVRGGRFLGHEVDQPLLAGEVAEAVPREQPDGRCQPWQEARGEDHTAEQRQEAGQG
jgi:hypothetical protein